MLAKHAPRSLSAVLDPAVGTGALLKPLVKRFRRNGTRIVCLDSDAEVLADLGSHKELMSCSQLIRIHTDFLDWSHGDSSEGFDCIFMNPPFSGKKSHLRKSFVKWNLDSGIGRLRYMPIEAAFLCKALGLLRHGGRLLCVVPCSIVMSESLEWIRRLLSESGALRCVHELPAGSFRGVESRMYVVVFDKGLSSSSVSLYNHDLVKPSRLRVRSSRGRSSVRLDFSYHYAIRNIDSLRKRKCYGWRKLGDLAEVLRGDVDSPVNFDGIHTSNFVDGFWHPPQVRKKRARCSGKRMIKEGDILVKRVGRQSCNSFGLYISEPGLQCSDCVFIVRPRNGVETETLLFAMKSLMELKWTHALLERGTGARYITISSLDDFWVPISLGDVFSDQFSMFVGALRNMSYTNLVESLRPVADRVNGMSA